MKHALYLLLILISTQTIAQTTSVKSITLWDNQIPNSQKSSSKESTAHTKDGLIWVSHVQNPQIEVYLPTKRIANGKGVLICPGGGYAGLAYDWEGTDMAKWLNTKGIAAFVLKYRLPNDASVTTGYLAPLQDAQRAMRIIKSKKEDFNLKEGQIGVMGFSAGGHLASTLGTHYNDKVYQNVDEKDTLSAKPDFMALIYPVISMKTGITHEGSKYNLLGEHPDENLITTYSNELQVTSETPPTFLVHANDDGAVPVKNSLLMYQALITHKVPVEMHLYPKGGHGFAFGTETPGLDSWTKLCENWLATFSN